MSFRTISPPWSDDRRETWMDRLKAWEPPTGAGRNRTLLQAAVITTQPRKTEEAVEAGLEGNDS